MPVDRWAQLCSANAPNLALPATVAEVAAVAAMVVALKPDPDHGIEFAHPHPSAAFASCVDFSWVAAALDS